MINIMYAGNDKAFDGFLMSLLSVTKHCKEELNVYFLTMDLSEKNPSWTSLKKESIEVLNKVLIDANKNSKIFVCDVRKYYEKYILDGKNQETSYTPYSMLRLLADNVEIIPDKILYLDYDVCAYNNIKELYDIDVTDYEFAGVKDYYGKFLINYRYVNSGVLLMNMKNIRKTGLFKKCLEMVKNKKMMLPDQSALNKKVTKKLIINRKFNEQHKLQDDTVIRHFSMTFKIFPYFKKQNIKPWNIEKLHGVLKEHHFDDILEKFLKIKNDMNK